MTVLRWMSSLVLGGCLVLASSCLVAVDPPPECFTNADCPSDETCGRKDGQSNVCIYSCYEVTDCLSGWYCVDYECSTEPECVKNNDCEYDFYDCINGECV